MFNDPRSASLWEFTRLAALGQFVFAVSFRVAGYSGMEPEATAAIGRILLVWREVLAFPVNDAEHDFPPESAIVRRDGRAGNRGPSFRTTPTIGE